MKPIAARWNITLLLVLTGVCPPFSSPFPTLAFWGSVPSFGQGSIESESPSPESSANEVDRWSLQYFGLLAGPSVRGLSPQQPTREGTPDPNRPVQIRNFHTLDYLIAPHSGLGVSATGQWAINPWEETQRTQVGDPYLRAYLLNLLPETPSSVPLYWYVDLRVHPGLSNFSRESDQLFGVQLFQALTWAPRGSRWTQALYLSLRNNRFGPQGIGFDGEVYFAPGTFFRMNRSLTASFLIQLPTFHRRSTASNLWETTGLDLEPGLSWDPTPNLNLSPYLTIPVGSQANSTKGTAFGLTLNWNWF